MYDSYKQLISLYEKTVSLYEYLISLHRNNTISLHMTIALNISFPFILNPKYMNISFSCMNSSFPCMNGSFTSMNNPVNI